MIGFGRGRTSQAAHNDLYPGSSPGRPTNEISDLSILIFSTPPETPTGSGTISAQITIHLNGTYDKPAVRGGLLAGLVDNGKSARTMSASVR